MTGPRKTPANDQTPMKTAPGVEEAHAEFEALPSDRWAIARERLAEYRRTGVSLDARDVLDAFVARVKARAALLK